MCVVCIRLYFTLKFSKIDLIGVISRYFIYRSITLYIYIYCAYKIIFYCEIFMKNDLIVVMARYFGYRSITLYIYCVLCV